MHSTIALITQALYCHQYLALVTYYDKGSIYTQWQYRACVIEAIVLIIHKFTLKYASQTIPILSLKLFILSLYCQFLNYSNFYLLVSLLL